MNHALLLNDSVMNGSHFTIPLWPQTSTPGTCLSEASEQQVICWPGGLFSDNMTSVLHPCHNHHARGYPAQKGGARIENLWEPVKRFLSREGIFVHNQKPTSKYLKYFAASWYQVNKKVVLHVNVSGARSTMVSGRPSIQLSVDPSIHPPHCHE